MLKCTSQTAQLQRRKAREGPNNLKRKTDPPILEIIPRKKHEEKGPP